MGSCWEGPHRSLWAPQPAGSWPRLDWPLQATCSVHYSDLKCQLGAQEGLLSAKRDESSQRWAKLAAHNPECSLTAERSDQDKGKTPPRPSLRAQERRWNNNNNNRMHKIGDVKCNCLPQAYPCPASPWASASPLLNSPIFIVQHDTMCYGYPFGQSRCLLCIFPASFVPPPTSNTG